MMRLTRISLLAVFILCAASPSGFAQDRPIADGSPIQWPSFHDALSAASESGRMIIIDIFAPTCGWCRKMQKEVYTKTDLQEYVFDTFEIGRIDLSINDDTISFKGLDLSSAQLAAAFGATGTPTTIFLEPNGDYITRLPGYHAYEEFLDVLQFIGRHSFREMSFTDYLSKKRAALPLVHSN
ncbi:MAG: thioredoxin fold domain-containing protein [Bacteroidetes bacterium]|nr:thioredoxin fold domain-containing protein [Bacteroidota bacterium]